MTVKEDLKESITKEKSNTKMIVKAIFTVLKDYEISNSLTIF